MNNIREDFPLDEITAKARQLARVSNAPPGSYDIGREAIAFEMADYMCQKTIEWLDRNFSEDKLISLNDGVFRIIKTIKFDSMDDMFKSYIKDIMMTGYTDDEIQYHMIVYYKRKDETES